MVAHHTHLPDDEYDHTKIRGFHEYPGRRPIDTRFHSCCGRGRHLLTWESIKLQTLDGIVRIPGVLGPFIESSRGVRVRRSKALDVLADIGTPSNLCVYRCL